MADEGRPGGPQRIAIGPCLPDEEAASRVGLQILGVHGHIADEEDGPTRESSAKGIREPNGNPGCLRDSVDRVATEVSDIRVRTRSAWLGSGSCGSAGPVDACWRGAVDSFDDIGFFTFLLW